ncbi:hypothetical protein B0H14DRAFT_3605476 [Mycena olivaceomarginata]|nr:hypothetical protein B0H14DRAFT_3605476 [Mycena olivaceomarginata]
MSRFWPPFYQISSSFNQEQQRRRESKNNSVSMSHDYGDAAMGSKRTRSTAPRMTIAIVVAVPVRAAPRIQRIEALPERARPSSEHPAPILPHERHTLPLRAHRHQRLRDVVEAVRRQRPHRRGCASAASSAPLHERRRERAGEAEPRSGRPRHLRGGPAHKQRLPAFLRAEEPRRPATMRTTSPANSGGASRNSWAASVANFFARDSSRPVAELPRARARADGAVCVGVHVRQRTAHIPQRGRPPRAPGLEVALGPDVLGEGHVERRVCIPVASRGAELGIHERWRASERRQPRGAYPCIAWMEVLRDICRYFPEHQPQPARRVDIVTNGAEVEGQIADAVAHQSRRPWSTRVSPERNRSPQLRLVNPLVQRWLQRFGHIRKGRVEVALQDNIDPLLRLGEVQMERTHRSLLWMLSIRSADGSRGEGQQITRVPRTKR